MITTEYEWIERRAKMAEYVDKSLLQTVVLACSAEQSDFTTDDILSMIEAVKPADVEVVRHGEWLDNGANYKCSECGNVEPYYSDPYCRVCGAKMDRKVMRS